MCFGSDTMGTHYVNFNDSLKRSWFTFRNLCLISVFFGFLFGLVIGLFVPLLCEKNSEHSEVNRTESIVNYLKVNSLDNDTEYSSVTFVENLETYGSNKYIEKNIYWSEIVEKNIPLGFKNEKYTKWNEYIKKAVGIKLQNGCGRMQNRLITFDDNTKGCIRYRQNTDQIQGELFSFYLGKILDLPNLAPSTISVVNLNSMLFKNLKNQISSAQWNTNRPIVITEYISDLNSANIPEVFKPNKRHLNKFDVINMTHQNDENVINKLTELAQWSDLIIFDYLTANLDRIVNNLYNYQWNINIMDAPAHNLAKKSDNNLLIFLDNESGLLHGYRLLKKYEIYHNVLLENLCIFRKSTVDKIRQLKRQKNVGQLLRDMFEKYNTDVIKEILPTIPDKSIKILNERIDRVYKQIEKCESTFGT